MKFRLPRRASVAWMSASLLMASASATGQPRSEGSSLLPSDETAPPAATAAVAAGLSSMLHAPLVSMPRLPSPGTEGAAEGDTSAWIRGRGWKAGVGPAGFRFSPEVGDAPDASIEMRLAEVTLGGSALKLDSPGTDIRPQRATSNRISLDRSVSLDGFESGLSEAYGFDLNSIEQTFTFDSLPDRKELRVVLDVATTLDVEAQEDGSVHFTRDQVEVRYSRAFSVDASGLKLPIQTIWNGSQIELVVPESIVRDAVLPLTIDPVITTTTPLSGFGNDGNPEVVWNPSLDAYVVVFEDRITGSDHDIYAFAVLRTGALISGSLQMLDASTVDHRRPRLAVHAADSRMMAVAIGRTQPGQRRRVYSMPFRPTSVGSNFFNVGPINQPNEAPGLRDCSAADVGGRSTIDNDNGFLVVWEVEGFTGGGDIRGRFISDDGTMGSATLDFAIDTNNSILPRVSASTGDPSIPDGTFNVVWIEDNDDDGRGRVRMRRTNPATESIGPLILVHASQDAVEAVATSNLSKELELRQVAPCVVAYVIQNGSGSSFTSSTVAKLVTLTNQVGMARVVSEMEDVRPEQLQADIDIATDGNGFMMVYTERPGTNNRRVYMCSGGIMDRTGSAFSVTLSERHQILETTNEDSRTPAICCDFDGGIYGGPLADDGACVWQVYDGFTDLSLRFARVDLQNNLPLFGDRPVGAQFCAAERNAGGSTGWIHAEAPNQSVSSTLRLIAEDLQIAATGYLIVADTAGYVIGPGGSAGNLCVIGAGRYVNSVGNAGITGRIETTVTPGALPQPTGPVSALPGDTWFFQYWYRDIQAGMATSNFTNAVAVYFTQ